MKTSFLQFITSTLNNIEQKEFEIRSSRQVFGGDINSAYLLITNEKNYFIKCNTLAFADMFEKEKDGLQLLGAANTTLQIPAPIHHGTYEQQSFLLMEYLEKGAESKTLWQQLGNGLAQLHQATNSYFGLTYDNYIGSLAQKNTPSNSWTNFYAQQRILPLMQQAFEQHKCTSSDLRLSEEICQKLSNLLPEEPPALLHGDLWSGNRMFTAANKAAVYDPAVYYGHREMDIAMTLLFGGFDATFYTAYNEALPLQKGWQQRTAIYQLYPLLVHLVLFGGNYYKSVKNILNQYV